MDRKTFIKQLKSKLWMRSSRAEIKKVVADYNKFFDESENIDEAIKSCGDINLIVDELINPLPIIRWLKLRAVLLFAMFPFVYLSFSYVYHASYYNNHMPVFLCAVLFIQMLIVGERAFKDIKLTTQSQKNTYKKILYLFCAVIGIVFLILVITFTIALITPLPTIVDNNTYLPIYSFNDALIYGSNLLLVMGSILAVFAFRLGKKIIPLMIVNMSLINLFMSIDIAMQLQDFVFTMPEFTFAVAKNVIIYMMIFFFLIVIVSVLYYLNYMLLYKGGNKW